jgi:hypothetical protein
MSLSQLFLLVNAETPVGFRPGHYLPCVPPAVTVRYERGQGDAYGKVGLCYCCCSRRDARGDRTTHTVKLACVSPAVHGEIREGTGRHIRQSWPVFLLLFTARYERGQGDAYGKVGLCSYCCTRRDYLPSLLRVDESVQRAGGRAVL